MDKKYGRSKVWMSLELIKELAQESDRLVYGFNTCWWKVGDPAYSTKSRGMTIRLPCGPRGELLLETSEPLKFIEAAEKNPEHYGEFGIQAFVSAYHGNVIVMNNKRPTSFETWDEYNKLL